MLSLQSLAISVVIALFVITFLVQAFQIPSESMENTLLVGDYLLVDKVHFADGGIWGVPLPYVHPKRGEIVVFHYPVNPNQYFVKRLIGLPGDHIRITDKQVWINGKPLDDRAYAIFRRPNWPMYGDNFPGPPANAMGQVTPAWSAELRHSTHDGEVIVPGGEYFVLGDNRDNSDDSRYWGFVPRENIVGRPLVIYLSVARREQAAPDTADGKLIVLALAIDNFWHEIRWNRILRVVR